MKLSFAAPDTTPIALAFHLTDDYGNKVFISAGAMESYVAYQTMYNPDAVNAALAFKEDGETIIH